MDNSKVMVIVFPDSGEDTARKMQAILRFISEGGGLTGEPEPGGNEPADIDGVDPANIRFRFADDTDDDFPPY
jgi:hypothetical protein